MDQHLFLFRIFCATIFGLMFYAIILGLHMAEAMFPISAQESQPRVPPPGSLELQPSQSRRVEEQGRGFIVTCRMPDHVRGSNLRWTKGSTRIPITNTGGRIHLTKPKHDKPWSIGLVFRNVTKEVEGLYVCVADIEGYETEAQKEFELSIYTGINFDAVETRQAADIGKDYTLKCAVTGTPQPVIDWRRNEVAFDSNGEPSTKYRVDTEGLTIYNVTKADGGSYDCDATQTVGDETSNFEQKAITLVVNYPPEFMDSANAMSYAFLGGEVNLTCAAEGEPLPQYEWGIKENEQFVDLPLSEVKVREDYSSPSYTFLTKNITEQSQFRDYVCRAKNPLGYVDRIFRIVEVERPQSPKLRLHRIHGNKVEFELEPPAMESPLKIVGYRALVRPKDGVAWENATIIDFNMGKFHIIDSLYHGTEYEIRFAARNELGYGEYSDVKQVKTMINVSSASVNSGLLSTMVILILTSWFLR